MKKTDNSKRLSFCSLPNLDLDFDDVTRKKLREQLDLNPSGSALGAEESELLMFLLYRSILY